jgi:DNA-binding response OmpR family regulator
MKTAAKGKILVVDDSSSALNLTRLALEGAGYNVLTKREAVLVSHTILHESPDIVLLDVNMPAVQGDKLVEIIRGHPANAGTLLLLYSGKPAEELEALVRACGADGFIQKGADANLLASQVDMWMGRREQRTTTTVTD